MMIFVYSEHRNSMELISMQFDIDSHTVPSTLGSVVDRIP